MDGIEDPALLRLIAERQVATELLATAADLLCARLLSSPAHLVPDLIVDVEIRVSLALERLDRLHSDKHSPEGRLSFSATRDAFDDLSREFLERVKQRL